MLVNVTYLIKDRHSVFNSKHFLIKSLTFSNKSTRIFYFIYERFLLNARVFSGQSVIIYKKI